MCTDLKSFAGVATNRAFATSVTIKQMIREFNAMLWNITV